ncbi:MULTISPECIES: lysophospholipid acyltransferase family protein [unclassified Micromonospora]|uniref:lysophospholipid acyltransferase family protein n=1 Tax=unclassified Micromonospora TaxID=2617518 RepID=UPI001B366D7A|nr:MULTISPECIES: lysophospholipid acyltransferase family protein [unclassified Micromonospora]MBQ1046752.1 1-acyl-sn-glycerol-3-phosphate acyltransferase [Micromonospora sp. C72]MBQ1056040.1 1-acyl-sn-glycerol-3-phosphate acyltransferase [Micromonospora sp. C32]
MARRRLGFWRRLAVVLVKPLMTVWTRRTWHGMEHLRGDGGVILVPNHISHADPLVVAHYIYDAGRWPRFLGKASVFRVPVVGGILHRCQQIPVERGTVEAVKSLDKLVAALDEGGAVVIYPEGTTTREPDLWPMKGKTGAARLALATGAPVVPIAMVGPERMFDPRTARFGLRPRTPVTVIAGPPVDLSPWAGATPTRPILEEMTDTIMLRIRDLVAEIRGGTPPPLWQRPARTGTREVTE